MSTQSIDRLIASRGPALVTYKGGFFFSKADIVIDLSKDTKPLDSSAFGPVTEINTGLKASTKFQPVGEFEHLDVLWTPFASMLPGTSLFGADADHPLLIQPLDTNQKQISFHAAAIVKPPDLNFTAIDTLIGDVEFSMIGKNNTPVDDAEYLFASATNDLDTGALPFDIDALLTQAYNNRWLSAGTFHPSYNGDDTTAAVAFSVDAAGMQTALRTIAALAAVTVTGNYTDGWTVTNTGALTANLFTSLYSGLPGGTSLRADQVSADVVLLRLYPWANFVAREGMKVAFQVQSDEDTSDAIGHYDTIFRGLSVVATGTPQGVANIDALAAAAIQGPTSVRGRRLGEGAHDLDIYGEGVFFRMYAANIRKSGLVYSSSKQRVPDLEWVASRTIADGGALNPLFFIGTAAP